MSVVLFSFLIIAGGFYICDGASNNHDYTTGAVLMAIGATGVLFGIACMALGL